MEVTPFLICSVIKTSEREAQGCLFILLIVGKVTLKVESANIFILVSNTFATVSKNLVEQQ